MPSAFFRHDFYAAGEIRDESGFGSGAGVPGEDAAVAHATESRVHRITICPGEPGEQSFDVTLPRPSSIDRFDGISAWPKLPAEQQLEIGAIALELVVAWFAEELASVPGADDRILRAADAADMLLLDQLRRAVTDALPADVIGEHATARIPSLLGQVCKGCGCSECDACEGGCGWAEPDLCTACYDKVEPWPKAPA